MKFTAIRFLTSVLRPRERTLAVFGEARLIKRLDGRIECRGGSVEDRRQAREWCSHFLHNAAIDVRPLPPSWDHRHGRGPLSHISALRSTWPVKCEAASPGRPQLSAINSQPHIVPDLKAA